jgi:putative intracellular protease/amidase
MAILMILTSHDTLGDTGQKTGFWLEEFAAPYYIFRDAGLEVALANPKADSRHWIRKRCADAQTQDTERFRKDKAAQFALANTHKLSDIAAGDYEAVFYPGGTVRCGIWQNILYLSRLSKNIGPKASR